MLCLEMRCTPNELDEMPAIFIEKAILDLEAKGAVSKRKQQREEREARRRQMRARMRGR